MKEGAESIYLDYAATTPVDPAVAAAMSRYMLDDGVFGNPASTYPAGRQAAAAVEAARDQLARLLNIEPRELIFTSGATESVNLAVIGAARFRADRGKHLITMPTEHKAATAAFARLAREGFEVSYLKPDERGLLPFAEFETAIREDTQLVSVMHVNNETGVIQDIARVGEFCRQNDILFHVDAAQSVGKLPIDLSAMPVDLLSMTAHKFYGPKGVGALYIADRPECLVEPLLYGGGQERGLRPGTLAVHQIVGLGAAAALAGSRWAEDLDHLRGLNERLWSGLEDIPGIIRNGSASDSFPGILNVSIEGIEGESLLLALEPLCVGTGAACSSQSNESSYVLRALGRDDAMAQSAIRFSFGRGTTNDDIDIAIARYSDAVNHLRLQSGTQAYRLPAVSVTGPYNELVRQYFANPVHAGRLPDAYNDGHVGEAAESDSGARVRLAAVVDGETIRTLRFEVYGCPHLIAAAEAFCDEAEGRSIAALRNLEIPGLMDKLAIPVEKTGKLFILEDAAKGLHIRVSGSSATED
jgi:cysteine desulfurase